MTDCCLNNLIGLIGRSKKRRSAPKRLFIQNQELLRIQLGVSLNADDFVFIRPDGSQVNPNAVTLAFRRIIKKAGLRDIRIHDLRHTHATLISRLVFIQR